MEGKRRLAIAMEGKRRLAILFGGGSRKESDGVGARYLELV
jgi:hypothetical protein